ncbi:MAG: metallophosphoesterase [Acidobacteria bacterium]|nr:metallophosphoesterase [Acidobacteriota bacterium]
MARPAVAAFGCLLLLCAAPPAGRAAAAPAPAAWYFAVSGDSRDCGDLIMPKIAAAIARNRAAAPIDFYWHLGDFRRMYDVDCDIAKRAQPDYDCAKRPVGTLGSTAMNAYLESAWQDFVERQIAPFGATPVFLGIGNHELGAGRTRDDFRRTFQKWLTQEPIHSQRTREATHHFYSNEGDTYYHFILKGIDFIYLDNADSTFSPDQLAWLARVLDQDGADPAVKTFVAAMHEALPYSSSRGHAMDASCAGLCSGAQAYGLLVRAQALYGKRVYVFASHAHLLDTNIFDQPEHRGQVLPGWLIGTAGAEQYRPAIEYGYLEVAVHADGSIEPSFKPVTRDTPPTSPAGDPLAEYCFTGNQVTSGDSVYRGSCACGATP